jgi:diacylglycerol kinase family enzyme
LHLDVVETKARGHAAELAFDAADAHVDVVIVLGGDGTVNEAVNGLLADDLDANAPALAVVPGGSTNVFARAVGMPEDQVEATGDLLEALREGRERTIGLGRADGRWFTFTAGIGLDADVVARVEERRAAGRRSTHSLYARTAIAQLARRGKNSAPLRVELDEAPGTEPVIDPAIDIALVLVGNTSPWTYLGRRRVDPFPGASFDLGLDLLALRKISLSRAVTAIGAMLGPGNQPLSGRNVVHRHDLARFGVQSEEPVAFQVDGDYLGQRTSVAFDSVPNALRVIV